MSTSSPKDARALGSRFDDSVRDIMRSGVVSVSTLSSLREAQRAMAQHGVHSVLVVDGRGAAPRGWITSSGMLDWLEEDPTLSCERAITEPVETIGPTYTAREALKAIRASKATHLLVSHTPATAPEGVVGELDLIALAAR